MAIVIQVLTLIGMAVFSVGLIGGLYYEVEGQNKRALFMYAIGFIGAGIALVAVVVAVISRFILHAL